jgi:hypothetical protein
MAMAKSKQIQEEIWTEAVAATRLPDSHPSSGLLLLPAINNMTDISTTRAMALQLHPPRIIGALALRYRPSSWGWARFPPATAERARIQKNNPPALGTSLQIALGT